MTEYDVKKKIDEAREAVKEYERDLETKKGVWHDDIKKGIQELTERYHTIGASGQRCPTCNGSGRIM
jgi:prefoldin subunit 5